MSIRSWLVTAIALAISASLAFAYLPFPNLSLEHLSSPHVLINRSDGGHGSGTHLGNGFILTANHVITGQVTIEVVTLDGDTYKAEVVSQAEGNDTAVIRIVDPFKIGVAYTECRDPTVGEDVWAIGNPHDLINVQTRGYIARKVDPAWILDLALIIDITVAPGMSGGAVSDIRGFLVGFVSAGFKDAALTIAVPPSVFCPILKEAGAL